MEHKLENLKKEKQEILIAMDNAHSNQKQVQLQNELYEVEHSIKILESYDSKIR